jgi:hypothetical protein
VRTWAGAFDALKRKVDNKIIENVADGRAGVLVLRKWANYLPKTTVKQRKQLKKV